MEYICVTGFGCTGSSAVIDLLKEYSCIEYEHAGYTYEHIFFRHPDGLIKTFDELLDECFGLQTDMTIRRFLNNARDITSTWGGRDFFINGRKEHFEKMVKQYVDEISQKDGEFESLFRGEYSLIEILKRRLLLVFGGLHKYRLKEGEYGWYTLKANNASLIDRTRELGENYLKMAISDQNVKYGLYDALLDVGNINSATMLFGDKMKTLIVMRDPRDRYIDEISLSNKMGVPAIVPVDVELYCDNYRVSMEILNKQDKNSYLIVQFEELIYNYDKTVTEIEQYLNLQSQEHTYVRQSFDPAVSIVNAKLYKRKENQEKFEREIEYIERELRDYLL